MVLALSLWLRITPAAAASNDPFANRTVIIGTNISVTASMTGATREPAEPNPFNLSPGGSLWWEWTSPFSGGVSVRARGAVSPVAIAVYEGDALTNLVWVAGSRSSTDGLGGSTSLRAVEGNRYVLQVESALTPSGTATLTIAPAPSNDDFIHRSTLSAIPTKITATLYGATLEPGEPPHNSLAGAGSLWWRWTPAEDQTAMVEVNNPSVALAIYSGEELPTLARVPAITASDFSLVRTMFAAKAGLDYQIAVQDQGGNLGAISLRTITVATNDSFNQRRVLDGPPVVASAEASGLTTEPGEPNLFALTSGGSLWYEWTAPFGGSAGLQTFSSAVSARIAVFTGNALPNLNLIATNSVWNAPLSLRTRPGETYLIRLDTPGTSTGTFSLRILQGPSNDDFANATEIVRLGQLDPSAFAGATREPQEPIHWPGIAGPTLWWKWTATFSGGVAVESNAEGGYDLAAYKGDSLTNLVRLSNDQSGDATPTRVQFRAIQGETYRFALESWGESTTAAGLKIIPGPANDDFTAAVLVAPLATQINGTTIGATAEPNEPAPGTITGLPSVWYRWQVPQSGGWELSVAEGMVSALVARTTAQGTLQMLANGNTEASSSTTALFRAVAGEDLYIRAQAWRADGENFSIKIDHAPANDEFETMDPWPALGLWRDVTTRAATIQPDEPLQPQSAFLRSLWWSWTAPATGGFRLAVTAADVPPRLDIHQGDNLEALVEVPQNAWTSQEGSTPQANHVAFRVTQGETYRFRLLDASATPRIVRTMLQRGPVNDDILQATPIELDSPAFAGSTDGATSEPGEPLGPSGQGATVWFAWTPPTNGRFAVMPASADVPIAISIFEGDRFENLTFQVRESGYAGPGGLLGFQANADRPLRFQVDSTGLNRGSFSLRLVKLAPNDDFSARSLLEGLPGTNIQSGFLGTQDAGEIALLGNDGAASLWWRWVAPTSGACRIDAPQASTPLAIAVFTGTNLESLVRVPTTHLQWTPTAYFHAREGVEYAIAVVLSQPDTNEFSIAVNPAPASDNFASPTLMTGAPPTSPAVDYTGGSVEPGEPDFPGLGNYATLWYEWKATDSRSMRASAPYPAQHIHVFVKSALEDLKLVSPSIVGTTSPASAVFRASAGETYLLQLAAPPLQSSMPLQLQILPGPDNDDFGGRLSLGAGESVQVQVAGTTVGGTEEPGEAQALARTNRASVWYSWVAPESATFAATAQSSTSIPTLTVFTGEGPGLGALTAVGSHPTGMPQNLTPGRVMFTAVAGTSYAISVDSDEIATGSFTLTLSKPPPYDNYAGRLILTGDTTTVHLSNVNASREAADGTINLGANTLWCSWQAPSDGLLVATLSASELALRTAIGIRRTVTSLKDYDTPLTAASSKSVVRRVVAAGESFDLALSTSPSDSTNLTLSLQFEPAVPLDGPWATPWQWSRGGTNLWLQQSNIVHTPSDALQGLPGSRMEALIRGPGKLTYWSKNGTLSYVYCTVAPYATGNTKFPPWGLPTQNTNWVQFTINLTSRTNSVLFGVESRSRTGGSLVPAWLDDVVFTPLPPTAPRLLVVPSPEGSPWWLRLPVEAQHEYTVLESPDLQSWSLFTNFVTSVQTSHYLPISPPTNAPARFFRAIVR